MKKIIALLVLTVSITCFSQGNWKNYNENYTINYPDDWKLDVSGQMNSKFILFSKLEENDTFSENVNLIIQNLEGQNISLKEYTTITENQIKTAFPKGKLIESKTLEKNSKKYQLLIYSGVVGGNHLQFKQYIFFKDKKAYILTFTANIKTYERYIKTGDKILNSFKLN